MYAPNPKRAFSLRNAPRRARLLKYVAGALVALALALALPVGLGQVGANWMFFHSADSCAAAGEAGCSTQEGLSGQNGAAAFTCFMQGLEERSPLSLDALRPCGIATPGADR